jgi:hypothetical protein
LEVYAGLQFRNWQFTFGKQELWWGTSAGGSMLFGSNAEPIPMLRITRVSPARLPRALGILGPMRSEFILGRLSGQHWIFNATSGLTGSWTQALSNQPFILGQKVSFKPTPNLELGFGTTAVFAGNGFAFTPHSFLRALFSTGNATPGAPSDPGDRRGEFDFAYRIPKLRNWLTFYGDAVTDDSANPWFARDKTAITSGLYLSHVPKIPKLDFRVEGAFTDLPGGTATIQQQPGFFYYNLRFRSGYTNNGNLIGSWIGRQGQGAEAWTNYWLSPKNRVQLHFRHQKVDRRFIPDGGTLTDLSASSDLWVRSAVSVSSLVQFERWAFPILAPNVQRNITGSVQVTFWPRFGKNHASEN